MRACKRNCKAALSSGAQVNYRGGSCLSLGLTAAIVLLNCCGCGSASQQLEYDTTWQALISGSTCSEFPLRTKDHVVIGKITCQMEDGVRHFRFPVGKFDIDAQVVIPAKTILEGNANPNDLEDRTRKPDPSTQTYFIATHGISDPHAPYCGTNWNLKAGDAQKLRIGFLLNSNTVVKNINFQGRDTIRPDDNGNLCGGGVFETPGCVSPGFGDGVGTGWTHKLQGCFDHTGKSNNLVTGDGKGVENVTIADVRLNELFLPINPSTSDLVKSYGSQLAVWVAMTQDGSATKNVRVSNLVSFSTRGDGINLHGNVQDSLVEGCHIENTGDDVYAFWGAYAENPSRNIFRNNVGKNPGVTRNYGYGVCVAIYGAMDVTIAGTKCFDRGKADWNAGQVPHGDNACRNGANCNSCLAYVHDWWFGAVYPAGNKIQFQDNQYFYMDAPGTRIPPEDRPLVRSDGGSKANVITEDQHFALEMISV
eukprot:TRINITY_DN15502_c0_g1_i1.p1 TRINITY_DN15502_c0_g1~~TRINITY_DN15502_c0_g1_i1.p1  ORF type:complete len:479 (+),score=17.21 TRINITY_DN15502_c0_g1_i1:35-1471(+)